jgi:hypothetical protein
MAFSSANTVLMLDLDEMRLLELGRPTTGSATEQSTSAMDCSA